MTYNKNFLNLSFIIVVFVFLIFWFGHIDLKGNVKYCGQVNRLVGVRFYLKNTLGEPNNISLADDFSECSYEFYKGIYDAFVLTGSSQSALSSACGTINKLLENKKWDQCYFLIGIANSYTARSKISDSNKLIKYLDNQINFCESSNNPLSCIAGVYTGVHLAFRNSTGDSKFPIQDDPFWVCRLGRVESYSLQCMRNIVAYIYDFKNGDINESLKYIEQSITSYYEKMEVIHTFFSSLAFRKEFETERMQILCSSFSNKDIELACITGYANGLTEVAKQDEAVDQVIRFCLTPAFSYQQQGECLIRGFSDIPNENKINNCLVNSPEKYNNFCSKVEV